MKPKWIVLDLDGTLLNADKKISQRNLLALRRTRSMGIKIIFATARPPRAVRFDNVDLSELGTVVFYNGALFQCRVTNQEIHYSISKEEVCSIVDYCLSLDPDAELSVEVNDDWYSFKPLDYRESMKVARNPTVISLEELKSYDCTKILLTGLKNTHEIVQRFAERVHILTTDDGTLLQIMALDSSKEKAVRYLIESQGDSMSGVWCFGDDYNDLGLFQSCGFSVAMGNAIPELKALATEVTDTNDRDGVALILERISV